MNLKSQICLYLKRREYFSRMFFLTRLFKNVDSKNFNCLNLKTSHSRLITDLIIKMFAGTLRSSRSCQRRQPYCHLSYNRSKSTFLSTLKFYLILIPHKINQYKNMTWIERLDQIYILNKTSWIPFVQQK